MTRGEWRGWWTVSVSLCVQDDGEQGPTELAESLLVFLEQAGEGLGLDSSLRGRPGLFPSPGLHFSARAIFEKLIFNDTSKP